MSKLSGSAKSAVVIVGVGAVLLGATLALTSSARLRAAFVAFRDPSLVRDASDSRAGPIVAAPLDRRDLAELGGIDESAAIDGGDAGDASLSGLVLPDLGIAVTPRIAQMVATFASTDRGREAFATRFRRAGRYRRAIEQSFRDADLPEDLVWICAIASGFEPQATSRRGAAGLFQIPSESASRFGLAVTDTLDERRSLTRGTAAGTTLLGELSANYGAWDLALAAFDLGREKLDESIGRLRERRSAREAKKPVTFEDLARAHLLPRDTVNFVTEVVAFSIVAANRGRFGLDDLDPAQPLDLAEIPVPAGTKLALIARSASVPLSVIRDYNPAILGDRAPGDGGDTLVAVPADRVAAALAAFPALYAREMAKLADAGVAFDAGSGRDAAAAESASPVAGPSAAASVATAPPSARTILSSGVVVEARSDGSGAEIGGRIDIARGPSFEVPALPVNGDLGAAAARLAEKLHSIASGGGAAAVELRRREGAARRQRLERAPYGASWIAVAERLFPPGSPLAGTVLRSPAMPLTSVAIADRWTSEEVARDLARAPRLTVTVTLVGLDLRAATGTLDRAFAGVLAEGVAPFAEGVGPARVEISEPCPSPRVVFAWLVPTSTEEDRAALRLAVLAIAHNEVGKVARTLVSDRRVASHVRGFLDVGERVSVLALEIVPSVLHGPSEVESELDAALASFGDQGPSAPELVAAKAQHRARVIGAETRAGNDASARERLERLTRLVDAVSAPSLAALVKRALSPAHRLVVVTSPRG